MASRSGPESSSRKDADIHAPQPTNNIHAQQPTLYAVSRDVEALPIENSNRFVANSSSTVESSLQASPASSKNAATLNTELVPYKLHHHLHPHSLYSTFKQRYPIIFSSIAHFRDWFLKPLLQVIP
jgi:hypothetical protein